MIPVLDRSLSVMLDGEPFSFSGRMRLRGEDELSLFPALLMLELWNLPEEYFLCLFRAKKIAVSHGDACLVSGTISDVFRHPTQEGVLTTVAISLGLDLWESIVSLSVPAGTLLSDAIRRILAASGTGIPLLSFPETDPVLPRSLSFFGRAAESVTSALTATSIVAAPHRGDRSFRLTSPLTRFPPQAVVSGSPAASSRPMLTPSGLMVVPKGGLSETVQITETDLTDTIAFTGGSQRGTKQLAVLSAIVSGWRPGQTVEVQQGSTSFRGIIVSRSVDADTATGPWKSEMIVEVL